MCVIAMGHRLPVTDLYEKKINANHFFKDSSIILFIYIHFWLLRVLVAARRIFAEACAGSSL